MLFQNMRHRTPKIQPRSQPAFKCIFCATNNANSREHFYSRWMHELLPSGTKGAYSGQIIHQHPKTHAINNQYERIKPGELYSKKMKVVCATCNNTWMSKLESAVKPLLAPIIKGEPVTLGASDLKVVAQWATLKTIICEHDTALTEVTPQEERTAFMDDYSIPSYFNIYLLSHNSASRIGHVRTTHTLAQTTEGPFPPLEGRQKNTQQISVILGNAMLHVNAARVHGIQIEDWLYMPAIVSRRIWPPNTTQLSWPSAPVLSDNQMRELAFSMDIISSRPQVKWGGEIESFPR